MILARDLAGGLVILALAILVLAGAWLPVAAQGTQGDGLRFGVGAAGAWGAEATALGVSWEQVSIEWGVIQPEADAFETEALDSRIEAARAAGRARDRGDRGDAGVGIGERGKVRGAGGVGAGL